MTVDILTIELSKHDTNDDSCGLRRKNSINLTIHRSGIILLSALDTSIKTTRVALNPRTINGDTSP